MSFCFHRMFLLLPVFALVTTLVACSYDRTERDQLVKALPDKLSTSASVRFVNLPSRRTHSWRYDLIIDQADQLDHAVPVRARVYCFRDCPQTIYPASRYRVNLYLEKYNLLHNPSGFDYQHWLERNEFVYGGRLFAGSLELSEDTGTNIHARVVNYLVEQFRQHDYPFQYLALVTGLRGLLEPKDRDILERTGTMHLLVVSGLHLGFVFLLVFTLVRLAFPSSHGFAGLAALLAMLGYAWLADFSLPSQRALIMATVACVWFFPGRRFSPWLVWLTALLLVLLINQPYVFDAGLVLSFGSVALLLLIFYRHNRGGTSWWQSLLIAQWYLLPGLWVLQLAFFDSITLLSLVANLIAIPLTGFIILPLLLLSCLLLFVIPPAGHLVLDLLDLIFHLLWQTLIWFEQIDWARIELAGERMDNPIVWLLAAALALLHLLPRGSPGKYAVILLVPLFTLALSRQPEPAIWVFASRDHAHLLYREGNYGLVISNAYQHPIRLRSIRYSVLQSLRYFDIDTIDWMTINKPLAVRESEIKQHLRNNQTLRLVPECQLPETRLAVTLNIQTQGTGDCLVSIGNESGSLLFVPDQWKSSGSTRPIESATYIYGLYPDDLKPLVDQMPETNKPVCLLPSIDADSELARLCQIIEIKESGALRIPLSDWSWQQG